MTGTSSGRHLTDEVDKLVSRTIAWIEQDMGRKSPQAAPQHGPGAKREFPPQQTASQPHPSAASGDGPQPQLGRPGTGYYGGPVPSQSSPYPPLAYHEQPGVGGGPSNGIPYDVAGNPPYIYSTAEAAASQSNPGSDHNQAPNPLVDFASHAIDPLSGQNGGGSFMTPGNPWHDWTAAMAEPPDRYSANALLNLHAAQHRVSVEHTPGGDAAAQMQWPLLLFHVDTGTVSGA